MNKTVFIFVGGICDIDFIELVKEKSLILPQFAAESFQRSFFNFFEKSNGADSYFISLPFIGLYRIHTLLKFYPGGSDSRNYKSPSFNTFPIFGGRSRVKALTKCINEIKDINPNAHFVVFCYSLYLPHLVACSKFKNKFSSEVTFIPIVPDLPDFTSHSRGLLHKAKALLKKFINRRVLRQCDNADGFILFVESMNSYFNNKKPFLVLNGLLPHSSVNAFSSDAEFLSLLEKYGLSSNEYAFYSGGLAEAYGVKNLVDAFCLLPNDNRKYKLVLCGKGDLDNYISMKIAKGYNILHCGVVSHRQSLFLQRNAKFLINPRDSSLEFTNFSFPSKMFEYLCARRPIVSYCLPPYDSDLKSLLIKPSSLKISDLSEALHYAFNLTKDEEILFIDKVSLYIEDNLSDFAVRSKVNSFFEDINLTCEV